ncbi:response regulator [Haladaptatus sp.]|uniref:response regulator n=1 Tax=Haladaptatus sp. TaxID=1973141 RepID=UPI003C4EE16D
MTKDIRALFVDPPCDADVSPDRLSDAGTDLTVIPAATMDDALGTLSETRIDCVLSGYSLPDTDGIELVNVVRQMRPGLPFILCTESGSEHVASRAISAGVSDYFRTQETDADTLANRIEQTIRPSSSNEPDRRFNHYQSIVQAMGDGVYTIDTNGRMTVVNDALLEMSGYDREELIGKHISVLQAEQAECLGA